MAAIEYGSYYWCVILNGKEPNVPGESVFLHADELAMDPTGGLIFKSAGRRPAGAEPKQKNDQNGDQDSSKGDKKAKDDDKNSKEGGDKQGTMIYMAFAPGCWKMVYAAKLQDGAPALVEHWNAVNGNAGISSLVPANSGAIGYPKLTMEKCIADRQITKSVRNAPLPTSVDVICPRSI
ncbi:MAG TPA: hypothetical protein VN861_09960 [Candidatus Acidoferrales bacterium]|nr:hypothetical protein [Candidatus Acidoferrales bacterium]